jgi:hypothetical protein
MIGEPSFLRTHWPAIALCFLLLGASAAIFALIGMGMFR